MMAIGTPPVVRRQYERLQKCSFQSCWRTSGYLVFTIRLVLDLYALMKLLGRSCGGAENRMCMWSSS